jgi:anaerobic ribonucleoside-triphosphate reductase activating protein
MWPHSPNTLIHRQTLLEQMLATDGLTGITLLGGEPLQQPRNTLWLLQRAKEFDLDVMLYSGYSLDEITADPGLSAVLGLVDILVAGRYEQDLRNITLRWRGSENQQVMFLSEKYSDTTLAEANEVEVIIDSQGAVTVLGYPSSEIPLRIIDG